MSWDMWAEAALSAHRLRDEVHVWHAALDLPHAEVRSLAGLLSTDERRRAERFVFDHDRRRFIVSHGLLRNVLAGYLDRTPSSLEFCVAIGGKPALTKYNKDGRLCFNMSHSSDMALFAVTKDREVGIDIEYCRPFLGMVDLARRFFSASEYAAMCSLAPTVQIAYFYSLWTCKEAHLKATGEGLATLDRWEISMAQDGCAALVARGKWEGTRSCWMLRRLKAPAGYAAALAVEGEGWNLVEMPSAGTVKLT